MCQMVTICAPDQGQRGAYGVTVRLALLLAIPAVGVWIVVTPEVVLGLAPIVVLVTLNVTVQLPLAGIVIPLKLSAVAPAVNVLGAVPTHVPPTAPPTALIFESASVKAPPVSAAVLPLVKVSVTVEDPPDGIEAGLNALAMVGGVKPITVVSVAVAEADPPPLTITVLICGEVALAPTLTVTVTAP